MTARLEREEGQALIEFAFVLPILLLLILGIVQFGILFNHSLTLTDAVREGAREGAVDRNLSYTGGAEADVEAHVRASSSDLNQTDLKVTVTSDWKQGDSVQVTATYPYEINLLGVVVASGFLSSTTTERVE